MIIESGSQRAVLFIMTEQEKLEFVPPDLESRLREMFPNLKWVEAPLQEDQWHELLREHQPEILLCAWETPPLPLEATEHLGCRAIQNLFQSKNVFKSERLANAGWVLKCAPANTNSLKPLIRSR